MTTDKDALTEKRNELLDLASRIIDEETFIAMRELICAVFDELRARTQTTSKGDE